MNGFHNGPKYPGPLPSERSLRTIERTPPGCSSLDTRTSVWRPYLLEVNANPSLGVDAVYPLTGSDAQLPMLPPEGAEWAGLWYDALKLLPGQGKWIEEGLIGGGVSLSRSCSHARSHARRGRIASRRARRWRATHQSELASGRKVRT